MLSPEQYGIDADSVARGIETDQEWYRDALIFISNAKQKSSVGINNRRTNIIEGLLNHCADLPEHDKLHQLLHRAWQVMYRALRFARPADELAHDLQVADALDVLEPIDDDAWWLEQEEAMEQSEKEETERASLSWVMEETQYLLKLIQPNLNKFVDQWGMESEAHLTWSQLRSWIPAGNNYSKSGGATKMLTRLREMCTSHFPHNQDAAQNLGDAGEGAPGSFPERLFQIIKPELLKFIDIWGTEAGAQLTCAVLCSWIPAEHGCSKSGGGSTKTLSRLKELCISQLPGPKVGEQGAADPHEDESSSHHFPMGHSRVILKPQCSRNAGGSARSQKTGLSRSRSGCQVRDVARKVRRTMQTDEIRTSPQDDLLKQVQAHQHRHVVCLRCISWTPVKDFHQHTSGHCLGTLTYRPAFHHIASGDSIVSFAFEQLTVPQTACPRALQVFWIQFGRSSHVALYVCKLYMHMSLPARQAARCKCIRGQKARVIPTQNGITCTQMLSHS